MLFNTISYLGGQISPGKWYILHEMHSTTNTHLHKEQTSEIVSTALELGINHFDVAESHAGKKKKL